MTLKTERLKWLHDAATELSATKLKMTLRPDELLVLTSELLANREAQPVALDVIARFKEWNTGFPVEKFKADYVIGWVLANYYAPPAPAVPGKPRLPPHVYRDLLDMLQEAAIAYGGTQQLRAQISSALSIHVQPDHPHTRAEMLAQPVSGGYKLVPAEATEDMIAAAMNCDDVSFNADETFCVNFGNIYAAMLAAAPEGGNGHDTRR
ncbi:hypothetical protein I5N18_13295 [Serratia marcescens]|uniref:hypothetical protein n=1 Tax=Serratia marcescens TaxID=615 RepID=UPI0018D820B6|nr:hypothetical protein [Serratia marcescens]MBH3228449.1 hypothetical protein [Serratia marcescens]MDU5876576.1 hypothetical protein [Serratia marcescens]HBC0574610.1 hypothetical protein [Serratia marcescens]HBC0643230.1 hypothetical protein [Serratia marcescens]